MYTIEWWDRILTEGLVVGIIAAGASILVGIIGYLAVAKKTNFVIENIPNHFSQMKTEHKDLSSEHKDLSSEHKDLSTEHKELGHNQAKISEQQKEIIQFLNLQEKYRSEMAIKDASNKKEMPSEYQFVELSKAIFANNEKLQETVSRLQIDNQILQNDIADISEKCDSLQKELEKTRKQIKKDKAVHDWDEEH